MIEGVYINEGVNTIAESKCPVYGFIRKVDYRKETVRYAVNNIRWFVSLVKHTVVSVGRSIFGASDQALGRILNNYDQDVIMEALHNVAEQPDFEQALNWYSAPEQARQAMEAYIGKMIGYTATEWVRTKLKDFEQNLSFETVLEERGDSVFADILKELGLEEEEVKRIIEDFDDATTGDEEEVVEEIMLYAEKDESEELSEEEKQLPLQALADCVFVDERGVYRDCRLGVMIMSVVFCVSHGLIRVPKDTMSYSLVDMYRKSAMYVPISERCEDNKTSFSSTLRFGLSMAEACGYGTTNENLLMDRLYGAFKTCPLSLIAKYSVEFFESEDIFLSEVMK